MLESFLNAIRNLWAVDELRRRVLFTLGMLAVYRAGIHVPVPGIDQEVLKTIWGDAGNLFSVLDLFSGGNLQADLCLRALDHALHHGIDHHPADDFGLSGT